MKIRQGIRQKKVGNRIILMTEEQIVDKTSSQQVTSSSQVVHTMNATASYLWDRIASEEFTQEMLVEWLLERYDIDRAAAEVDVNQLVQEWMRHGLVV